MLGDMNPQNPPLRHLLVAAIAAVAFAVPPVHAQAPFLSSLAATKDSPIFTTYAARKERSEFTLDKGYHLVLNDSKRGADLTNESGGDICVAFRSGTKYVYALKDMSREPVITASYPDLVRYTFRPFDSISVAVMFVVYSSRHAVQSIEVTNTGSRPARIEMFPFVLMPRGTYGSVRFRKDLHAALFAHLEHPDAWVLEHGIPHVDTVRDVFVLSDVPDRMTGPGSLPPGIPGTPANRRVGFACARTLRPGETHTLVAVRSVARPEENQSQLIDTARALTALDIPGCLADDERLYSAVANIPSQDPDRRMLTWSAYSLMRQVMLPPEGKCHYNYYVFSREPRWGWGHGGQVFHESLTMVSYALMDPAGAMNSQRIYMERQKPDGYINYRTGPYLDEDIPFNGGLTTSAPLYAWENWEIYNVTRDRKFLEDAYASGASLYRYYCANRDSDGDGLCEWGGHAVLESVRDGKVAVWDQVGWPAQFESVDLNSMLVAEAKSLASMAMTLGRTREADVWEKDVQSRCRKINALMWDSASGFYYNIDRRTHTFTSRTPDDLKRMEIIGFLPLWAGIATREQAARLVANLTDTSRFWRRYGVPSLAASDRYYDPKGYWNGPVWVQWNFLIVRGLLRYGYVKEAREVTNRVAAAMIQRLRKDHDFWEFYSPDESWGGYHRTYIWAGVINRMILETAEAPLD